MGFLSNTQLTGTNKVKTEASLAFQFEKCQCAPELESLYGCIRMYVSTWSLLNSVLYALIKKARCHISSKAGKQHSIPVCQPKDGLFLSAALVRRNEVCICAIYSNSSKWDCLTWIPDNCSGCSHLLSVTSKSITLYAKVKKSPWQLCISKLNKRSKT